MGKSKEGNSLRKEIFYLTTHSTHFLFTVTWRRRNSLKIHSIFILYLWFYGSEHMVKDLKGRKEMFYLMMHSTHFIYGYMVSDSERKPATTWAQR